MSQISLSALAPFVAVAETLSFRQAADRLHVTPAAVSRAIARLEEDLGVALFVRTSRKVALTSEGALFLARTKEALGALEAGVEGITDLARTPKGNLVVTTSPLLARPLLRTLATFRARYPAIALTLRVTDRVLSFEEDEIDVALRLGPPTNDSVIARPLFATRWQTVAAPSYLARHGTPTRPDDLALHNCLRFQGPRGAPRSFQFVVDDSERAIDVSGSLVIDQGEHLLAAAEEGLGIAQVLDFMTTEPIRTGRLQPVLERFGAEGPMVYLVFLGRRRGVPRVRAFVDYVLDAIR
jgi:LysR family transcriptional regulator for bpeEF and oprC